MLNFPSVKKDIIKIYYDYKDVYMYYYFGIGPLTDKNLLNKKYYIVSILFILLYCYFLHYGLLNLSY